MADWYVSSANYAAIPIFVINTPYTVGQFIKPTAATWGREQVWRCTTAGTSGATEPAFSSSGNDNATITSGTAQFTNVTGQSAYGWTAAAGTLFCITGQGAPGNNRNVAGSRIFIASDHTETNTLTSLNSYWTNNGSAGSGLCQFLSVNRAGSVPPTANDIQNGAVISASAANLYLESFLLVIGRGYRSLQLVAPLPSAYIFQT